MTDQDKTAPTTGEKLPTGEKLQGEGNYDASRRFDADEREFIDKNREAIPGLAKEAAEALDGPEGDELRKADADTKAHAVK